MFERQHISRSTDPHYTPGRSRLTISAWCTKAFTSPSSSSHLAVLPWQFTHTLHCMHYIH